MRRAAVLLALLLEPVAAAVSGEEPWLTLRFDGVHAASAGLCDDGRSCHATFVRFDLPAGARSVQLALLNDHREPLQVGSNFDLYLDSPGDEVLPLFQNGLAPAMVRGCFPPETTCDFDEPRRTRALAAAPGAWEITYRGVHYGDLTLGVFVE